MCWIFRIDHLVPLRQVKGASVVSESKDQLVIGDHKAKFQTVAFLIVKTMGQRVHHQFLSCQRDEIRFSGTDAVLQTERIHLFGCGYGFLSSNCGQDAAVTLTWDGVAKREKNVSWDQSILLKRLNQAREHGIIDMLMK